MATLVVATTADPASAGPASALLAMPGWHPGPSLAGGDGGSIASYANGGVRLLQHGISIVAEDDLDRRWEAATGEAVGEVIFLSKHTAVTNRPALTVHPIGVPHLREDEVPPQGGRPGWAGLPNPRIAPWFRRLMKIAQEHGLIPEFEVTLEATHHGPVVSTPTMFVEIESGLLCILNLQQEVTLDGILVRKHRRALEEARCCSSRCFSSLLWEGLGLDGGDGIGQWDRCGERKKVLLGIGGGHYVPRHMDIVVKDGVWVGHLLSGYSLPMEDPKQQKPDNSANGVANGVGGTWKQAIKTSFEVTKAAFPGGEIIAHLDHKSFKGWQKNVITSFLAEENIQVGKPADFF